MAPPSDLEFEDPNEELFFGVAWSDRPGMAEQALQHIRNARQRGADLEATSDQGETPLTAAIGGGLGSPKAVALLLELGADPSRRDDNGWTPWAVCIDRSRDRVVQAEMQAIRSLLEAYGADRGDEEWLALRHAIATGDAETVRARIDAGIDLRNPLLHAVAIAASKGHAALVAMLLEAGADPEGHASETESPLFVAARNGEMEIVRLLVEAGARLGRVAHEDPRFTPEFIAREEGHSEVADWLAEQTHPSVSGGAEAVRTPVDSRVAVLYQKRTSGTNYGLSTEDIARVLMDWDRRLGIELSEVEHNRVVVHFARLPDSLDSLAREIYELCPDVIEQGYGCMDQLIEMSEASGRPLPPDIARLVEGIDFDDDDFGLKLLQRDLQATRRVSLWWD